MKSNEHGNCLTDSNLKKTLTVTPLSTKLIPVIAYSKFFPALWYTSCFVY